MKSYTKVTIILKDAQNHNDYNKRIIEYLNDRHVTINDNMFSIVIDIVDNTNINSYVSQGMESIPAMKVGNDGEFIYGVNSIVATLAKLEIVQDHQPNKQKSKLVEHTEDDNNAFYKMALEEMQSDEQEDPDSQSSVKGFHQELPEIPLSDKLIEDRLKSYNKIYDERKRRNGKNPPHSNAKPKQQQKTGSMNIDKFIASGEFDKGEEMLMRQIAQNCQ